MWKGVEREEREEEREEWRVQAGWCWCWRWRCCNIIDRGAREDSGPQPQVSASRENKLAGPLWPRTQHYCLFVAVVRDTISGGGQGGKSRPASIVTSLSPSLPSLQGPKDGVILLLGIWVILSTTSSTSTDFAQKAIQHWCYRTASLRRHSKQETFFLWAMWAEFSV